MLRPEYLAALPEPLVVLMEDLEEWTIRDIARRLDKAGLSATARHQTARLLELYDERELREKLKNTTERAETLADALFDRAMDVSFTAEKAAYASVGKVATYKAVESLIAVCKEQYMGEALNLTGSLGFAEKVNGKTVFKPIARFYQDALNKAQLQVMTGVSDARTAIKQAVDTMARSGLRTVEYDSGRTMRIDAAARCAVMSGANRASARMTDHLMQALGAEYVETTAHAGARPSHVNWQGRQFKVNGEAPGYPNFAEATGYGDVDGLCGANCCHSYFPYFPGYSTPAYTEEELRHIDPPPFAFEGKTYTAYEATQMQRKYERSIRATRDKLVGYDAAGLDDAFTASSARLKTLERGYRQFSKAAGLPTQTDRLQTLGFGKSTSAKAVWAHRKMA